MTSNLEQQLFKIFKISKVENEEPRYSMNWEYYTKKYLKYPEINSKKLLEMICILNDYYSRTIECCSMLTSKNVEDLKNEVIKEFLDIKEQLDNSIEKDDKEEINWIQEQLQNIFKGDQI